MKLLQNTWFIVVLFAVFLPLIVILLSMCTYIGKVWAIRILFNKNDENKNDKGGIY